VFLQIVLYPVVFIVDFLMKKLQRKRVENNLTDEEVEAFIDM
jgi:hypothetical protein